MAILCLTAAMAQTGDVWEQPTTEFGTDYGDGFFNIALDVTRVELKDTETTVAITLQQRSDYPDFCFQFSKGTYLLADGKRYPVVSADNIEFDKLRQTEADGKLDMVFHFQPLPKGTKVFDFIEGDGKRAFQIKGIRSVEERHKMLVPSYWRNVKTGDWEIAFLGDYAIYDCKVWNMKANGNKFTLTTGDKTINVEVGKNKKGKRRIVVDGKKSVYEMITTRFLPNAPTKDTRTNFVDTNYRTDTVTVVGWIKDMPERYRSMNVFNFGSQDLFIDEQRSFNAELDSLGRFSIKIPLLNSAEFFCDWERCFMRTMLEPGKKYFLLYDFKEGRRMWMGDDVRLQNELFKYPLDWKSVSMEERDDDFNKYIASTDSLIKAQHAYIDNLCRQHPTLSTRFNIFRKGNTTWQQAREFGQARFNCKDFRLPENACKYAYDNFWMKMPKPYTLYRSMRGFWNDYLNDAIRKQGVSASFNMFDHAEEIASSPEELALINDYMKWAVEMEKTKEAASEPEEKQRIADEFNTANVDIIKQVENIMNSSHARKVASSYMLLTMWQQQLHVLDSLGADRLIKEVWVTNLAYNELDNNRKPLSSNTMDTLRVWIDNPEVLAGIEKKNDFYHALSNRQLDKLILNTGKDVQGMTEGEEILKKILEPYRGKIVLIDIWGTWCGPCKKALSHSEEEYARLADYDIQYVYLANRSPKDSWENVIKEYNVTGPHVAHFNLPEAQQEAIERFLKIYSYPTYKLVDKQGNILDIKVDARNLNDLEKVIKMLSDK